MGTKSVSRSILVAIGMVVVVLIGVATVIALQPPPVRDPATPEGTAQGYFQGLHDGDNDLVVSYLTDDLSDRCDATVFLEGFGRYDDRDPSSVSIVSTSVEGDEARVRVTISVTYGEGPFLSGSDTFDETMVMAHQGDRWLISEPVWPWDRYSCGGDDG